ncbi:MAG: VWA domain-containing protein [Acidobacteria bacterium]|nr:VWA domain-containing protein [Acidobacteriota bacterium]
MRKRAGSTERRKGMTVIMSALMMTFTVPIVGLAIDSSLFYGVRARLSSAADAAAIAGARSLSTGLTIEAQESNARATARRFFDANFPTGFLNTSNPQVDVTVQEVANRTREVTVTTQVTAPHYFMQYLGKINAPVAATGQARRRDINVMIVIDRSGSLQSAGACGPLRAAATSFVNKFANLRDRVGLVTFGGDYRVDFAMQNPPGNFLTGTGSIPNLISSIVCVGNTNSAGGLWKGYQELVRINEPGTLNAILFFTDGQPNALTVDFTAANALRTVARGYTAVASPYTSLSRSPCATSTNKRGWIYTSSGVSGIKNETAPAMPLSTGWNGTWISDKAGCAMNTDASYVHRDFGFLPPTDIFGNALRDAGYKSTTLLSSGPDAGKLVANSNTTLTNGAINALNDAARRIRNNATAASELNTVIYSLGLGGVGAAEDQLLNRVANTKASPIFDASKFEGMYVYAPSPTELNEAFARIAGEILRIAQ